VKSYTIIGDIYMREAVDVIMKWDEYHFLVKAMKLRNAVAHGFKAENFESAFVQKLLDIITHLLQTPPDA
jgi:hypothetical protein